MPSTKVFPDVHLVFTVMPSVDFRASSITVVMAVRWGVRDSGQMVATEEYRLYLRRKDRKFQRNEFSIGGGHLHVIKM